MEIAKHNNMELQNTGVTKEIADIENEIRRTYHEANALSIQANGTARNAVMKMAECGLFILMGKEKYRGNKVEWIRSLGIKEDVAEKAVHLARNRDQLELALWPSDIAKMGAQIIGMLPPPSSANRMTDDPERSTAPANSWLTHAGKLQKAFKELFTARPITHWREDERENVRFALRPLVDLYESLR
jgi:hypothetical protein